jgi:thymidylate synthase (FAD)
VKGRGGACNAALYVSADFFMRIIKPCITIEDEINGSEIIRKIERIGRTCYKSEDKITGDSAEKFVKMLIERGHEAMIEHVSISVRIVCDRGVSHELVRHRIASYAQESTRYCNYTKDKFGNELTFIEPCFWNDENISDDPGKRRRKMTWENAMQIAEKYYFELIGDGATPEEARSVLPNSIKTEIVATMNLREWRHFLKLRTDKAAHPQMRETANMILEKFKSLIPVVFNDIGGERN